MSVRYITTQIEEALLPKASRQIAKASAALGDKLNTDRRS